MKKFVALTIIGCLLIGGTAIAGKNPGSIDPEAVTTTVEAILFSEEGVPYEGVRQFYINSTGDAIKFRLWKYDGSGGTVAVGLNNAYAASDSFIHIPANYIWTGEGEFDYITAAAESSTATVFANWFRE